MTKTEEVSRNILNVSNPILSGHCGSPQTAHPEESHARCQRNGGGVLIRSTGRFHPCPCRCHMLPEDYDCGECGYLIREAPALGLDEDGDPRYVHVDEAGDIYSVECP